MTFPGDEELRQNEKAPYKLNNIKQALNKSVRRLITRWNDKLHNEVD